MVDEDTQARRVLWQIRMVHTIASVVFASSIVAIPIVTLAGRIHTALWLSLLVWVEVFILAANRLRCPLTGWPDATQRIDLTTSTSSFPNGSRSIIS